MPKQTKRRKAKIAPRRAPRSMIDRLKAITIGDAGAALYNSYKMASQALATLNAEMKVSDNGQALTATDWTGVVTPLSLLAQGSDYNTRDGDSIRAHGLELRWTARSATATSNFVRTVVLADRQQSGAGLTSAQILQTIGSAFAPSSQWNFANERMRLDVLYDSGPIGVDPVGRLQVSDVVVIPYNDHIMYLGAAGTAAECRENTLFVLQISDIAAAGPVMGFVSRLHFVDN